MHVKLKSCEWPGDEAKTITICSPYSYYAICTPTWPGACYAPQYAVSIWHVFTYKDTESII